MPEQMNSIDYITKAVQDMAGYVEQEPEPDQWDGWEQALAIEGMAQSILEKRRSGVQDPITPIQILSLYSFGINETIREIVREYDDPLSRARIGQSWLATRLD